MEDQLDRRTRKRLAMRQNISDAATKLFFERGFDNVTVDDIAEAADVGRMTVFNHFARKEDMFFDQEEEARDVILDAVRTCKSGLAPIEALRLLAYRLIENDAPYIRFFEGSRRFVETVAASEALKARARAIRDEVARALSESLALVVDRPSDDPDAQLAAHLLLTTWSVAFTQAHAAYRRSEDVEMAKNTFLAVVEKGAMGVTAAMIGTPYAQHKSENGASQDV
ncbi:AcrR family transcriptional regulator [Robbsia andropogonis]|uniref:TetR/AcrR family transcriptional regulator n=1 Tax=Robbsia andropogonis TaxID=28092 RepID=UPI002A69DE78|nr:TetR/AcrR family transcriptional regulator [Robbsia andropogonis]